MIVLISMYITVPQVSVIQKLDSSHVKFHVYSNIPIDVRMHGSKWTWQIHTNSTFFIRYKSLG